MQQVDLGSIVQDVISRFGKTLTGVKPRIFVTFSPLPASVPWPDRSLEEFLRYFLYESLLASGAGAPVEISLRQRASLKNLNGFINLEPSYWIQAGVSGQQLGIDESMIEELFSEIGFRCERWLGNESSDTRLGIFRTIDSPNVKMIFSMTCQKHRLKCELLLPISDPEEAEARSIDVMARTASRGA